MYIEGFPEIALLEYQVFDMWASFQPFVVRKHGAGWAGGFIVRLQTGMVWINVGSIPPAGNRPQCPIWTGNNPYAHMPTLAANVIVGLLGSPYEIKLNMSEVTAAFIAQF